MNLVAAVVATMVVSCVAASENGFGELVVGVDDNVDAVTRADSEIPDVEDFLLDVRDASGNIIYSGTFGASPEAIQVSAGNCYISVRSSEFAKPKFSCPVYGDDVCVVVPSGGIVNAFLSCSQVNSGIRLKVSPAFLDAYPSAALILKSSDGSLNYSYSEKRFAYFRPGNVNLVLTDNGTDTKLLSRELAPKELLTLNIGVTSSNIQHAGISVSVDTSRVWSSEDYVIGGEDSGGGEPESAYTVDKARDAIGETDVWVKGYIVGGDLTASSSGISFQVPFSSRTNIAIASRSSVTAKSSCIAVNLPSGDIRDGLNLVDRPQLLGRMVYLKGDIVESYYGLVGLKNISEFRLK
ncbi:MAG: DUF6359 domain-containing protein [Candidatus Cryptobacteroides sp.]